MRHSLLPLVLVLGLLPTACNRNAAPPVVVPPPESPPRIALVSDAKLLLVASDPAERADGGAIVSVEIAASHADRERGLGGRETLPDGRGMLFVYGDSDGRTFWMKDCFIALDIAFLDADGVMRDVVTLPPGVGLSGKDIPAHTCASPVRYVLEVRARWLDENGIGVGDTVDVSRVTKGVIAE